MQCVPLFSDPRTFCPIPGMSYVSMIWALNLQTQKCKVDSLYGHQNATLTGGVVVAAINGCRHRLPLSMSEILPVSGVPEIRFDLLRGCCGAVLGIHVDEVARLFIIQIELLM